MKSEAKAARDWDENRDESKPECPIPPDSCHPKMETALFVCSLWTGGGVVVDCYLSDDQKTAFFASDDSVGAIDIAKVHEHKENLEVLNHVFGASWTPDQYEAWMLSWRLWYDGNLADEDPATIEFFMANLLWFDNPYDWDWDHCSTVWEW